LLDDATCGQLVPIIGNGMSVRLLSQLSNVIRDLETLKKIKARVGLLDDAMSCGRWHVCPLVVLTFQRHSGLGNVKKDKSPLAVPNFPTSFGTWKR